MGLPLRLLEQLPPSVLPGAGAGEPLVRQSALALGYPELEAVLPDRGFLHGVVTELALRGSSGLATTLSLAACSAAQREAKQQSGEPSWCAFVDGSGTLHAPGVAQSGVALEHLLVVRPPPEALGRVAIRLAESRVFSVLVVDLLGVPGQELQVALGDWARAVRRISMSLQGTRGCVLLLTRASAARPLPLPVAQRIELERPDWKRLRVRIVKDRQGRVGAARTVPWTQEGPGLRKTVLYAAPREVSRVG